MSGMQQGMAWHAEVMDALYPNDHADLVICPLLVVMQAERKMWACKRAAKSLQVAGKPFAY